MIGLDTYSGDDVVWTATGYERPVFLDERGRRRRWVLLGGALTGGASSMWLGAIVGGAIGFSNLPSLRAVPRSFSTRPVALADQRRDSAEIARRSSRRAEVASVAVSRGALNAFSRLASIR